MFSIATITIYLFKLTNQLPVQLFWAKRISVISQMVTEGFFRGSKVRLYTSHTL